mgnify:CR=1 FL=1
MDRREKIARLAQSKEDEVLLARVYERITLAAQRNVPANTCFLSKREQMLAQELVRGEDFRFFGGTELSEREVCCYLPEYLDESWLYSQDGPIAAVRASFFENDKLTHRDFLGSLMGSGIKRETVGDILIEEGRAVVFVCGDVKEYILNQVEKIGRVGVNMTEGCSFPLPEGDRLEEFTATAASDRIDCIAASLCGLSRSKICELIAAGLITVNSVSVSKPTKSIAAGDVISVRGKGRYIAVSLDGRTKKDRIIIKYKKYIQEVKKC